MIRSFIIVAIAIVLTWPFIVGRWIFDAECSYLSGIHIDQTPDARSEGFFDYRLFQQRTIGGVSSNNFLRDVKDLSDGRVAYFEAHRRTSGWNMSGYGIAETSPRYERFFLADRKSKNCVYYNDDLRKKIASLSDEKCLASEQTDSITSRYEIRTFGYHHTDSRASTEIIDKKLKLTVAKFWSFNHFNSLNFVSGRDDVCPRYADRSFSPHQTLTSMVFVDRLGKRADLKHLEMEDDERIKRLISGQ